MTPEVRARMSAQDAASSLLGDTAGPSGSDAQGEAANANGSANGGATGHAPASQAPLAAVTDTPPVLPARLAGLDLGPACGQCGGMMQRTGSCYTCGSCGFNTGCG